MKPLQLFKFLSLAFCICAVLILRPVPSTNEGNMEHASGVVSAIQGGGENDIVFHLKDEDTRYYINRGLDLGFSLAELREDLLGKRIDISYPGYWSPLSDLAKIRHLSSIKLGKYTIFDETRDKAG